MKRLPLRGGCFVGEKCRQQRPTPKGSVTGNRGGQSGHKRRKAHLNAIQPPCMPSGVGYGTSRCRDGRFVGKK